MQAMNTGHDRSMSTIHANSARDALARIKNMVLMANANIPVPTIMAQIASGIDLVVHTERMRDGVRRIAEVIDVAGIEEEALQLQTLFKYEYEGENPDGSLHGRFDAKPLQPSFLPRLRYFGMASEFLEALGVAKTAEV